MPFSEYQNLNDDACQERILAAKAKLGKRLVILGHHYQRSDVFQHADFTGDSLKLSRLAAESEADYIVFCGVHFMAEVADILSRPEQISILPDLAAGCSMADMATLATGRARLARAEDGARSRRDLHARHLHQFGGRPESLLRRARRHRLHLQQCHQNTGMVVCPARKGAVLPRSASGALERPQDGHSAGRHGAVGLGSAPRRAYARAGQEGQDHFVERAVLGAPDVPAGQHTALSPGTPGRPGDFPPGMQFRGVRSCRITSAPPSTSSRPSPRPSPARTGWWAPS